MAMEVILSTAFGRAVDVQGGKGGKLFESAVEAFDAFSPDSQKNQMSVTRMIQFLMCEPTAPCGAHASVIYMVWF